MVKYSLIILLYQMQL